MYIQWWQPFVKRCTTSFLKLSGCSLWGGSVPYFFFFYNCGWVFAILVIIFHSSLLTSLYLHCSISSIFKSSSISWIHFDLGLPLLLFHPGSHSVNAFKTDVVSLWHICLSHIILCTLVSFTMFSLVIFSSISCFITVLLSSLSLIGPHVVLIMFFNDSQF